MNDVNASSVENPQSGPSFQWGLRQWRTAINNPIIMSIIIYETW